MAQELITSVGLSGKDLSGRVVQVEEAQGCSAGSSVVSSLMWNLASQGMSLVLVTLYHGETHYQSLCKKLGFNLKEAQEKQKAVVLDPFDLLVGKDQPFSNIDMSNPENLKRLFFATKEALNSVSGDKALIVDDLSALVSLGASLQKAITFTQQCRNLQERSDKKITLVFGNHVSEDSDHLHMLSSWVFHIAHFRIAVAGLKTGFSANVTGSLEVTDHLEDYRLSNRRTHHFKLTERQIKVFAPGSVGIKS